MPQGMVSKGKKEKTAMRHRGELDEKKGSAEEGRQGVSGVHAL